MRGGNVTAGVAGAVQVVGAMGASNDRFLDLLVATVFATSAGKDNHFFFCEYCTDTSWVSLET